MAYRSGGYSSGSTPSACRPAISSIFGPIAPTYTGTGRSSRNFIPLSGPNHSGSSARSTSSCPSSARSTTTAVLVTASGRGRASPAQPRNCSAPAPTPSANRPPLTSCAVAAAMASSLTCTEYGFMTAMPRPIRVVRAASAPASTGAERRNRSLENHSWLEPGLLGRLRQREQFGERQVVVDPDREPHGPTTAMASISTRKPSPIRAPT